MVLVFSRLIRDIKYLCNKEITFPVGWQLGQEPRDRTASSPLGTPQTPTPPSLLLAPQHALFLAIDLHCVLQQMEAEGQGARPQEDEVTYFVNRDSQGWVAQTVRRRVYIELKIECTLYRSRDVQKARDDWLCVYCRNGFPSKLRLSDHRVGAARVVPWMQVVGSWSSQCTPT